MIVLNDTSGLSIDENSALQVLLDEHKVLLATLDLNVLKDEAKSMLPNKSAWKILLKKVFNKMKMNF